MNTLEALRRVKLKRDFIEIEVEDDAGNTVKEKIHVRAMTAAQRHKVLEFNNNNPKAQFPDAGIAAMVLIYEDGSYVFPDPDCPEALSLHGKPEGLMREIATTAIMLSRMPRNREEAADVEKKS